MDRSEIEATADRNLAIMQAMLDRTMAALGETEEMPAMNRVIFQQYFTNLSM